jgi:short-subunit dehydrogenase
LSARTYARALVTGASSGIGRGLALWLGRAGVRVWAAARRADELEQLRRECDNVVPLPLDVSDVEAVRRTVAEIDQTSGGFDLVIANAGISGYTDARRLDWERVAAIVQVNVLGAAATLSAALPGMVARDRGHLVGISSVAALRGMPGRAAYGASKAFLSTYLEGLRVDLVGTGIHVTCIQPGFIETPLTAKNPFRMPFILPADVAVSRIGRAILARRRVYTFPWQMALVMRLARWLPGRLADRLLSLAKPASMRSG